MRIFHVAADRFVELTAMPDALPATGFIWVGSARREFEVGLADVQAALQRWTGGQLLDLHVSDLLNPQLPSHFDYTSWYDLLVFRRLAAGSGQRDSWHRTETLSRPAGQGITPCAPGISPITRSASER